jgi:tRNA-Thr(GGU) m(6)t(6)A37 methyltransferase TsaA
MREKRLCIKFEPIGRVHSPYKTREEIQPLKSQATEGEIEIYPEYTPGLSDIDGFSHIFVLFLFHRSKGCSLKVKPLMDTELRGLFATRHPNRPNPIGLTVVELLERKENILRVRGLDMLNGTPVLDIKPYSRRDQKLKIRIGWLEELEGQK